MKNHRVLIAHAYYRQRGGEDIVAEQEADLLEAHGHEVYRLHGNNRDINEKKPFRAAIDAVWSTSTTATVDKLVREFRPDVIHVHNTFPSLSPSLYWAAARHSIPIVQTLHNFRLLCPQAMLLRNGNVCEDCVGHLPWRAITRSCYRDSHTQSAVLAGMLTMHRGLGTYQHKITRYIALNRFCRDKFIEGGLPATKISVKPNFAHVSQRTEGARSGALYAGRIANEKGIGVLIEALSLVPSVSLQAVGDGPEAAALSRQRGVTMRGWLSSDELMAIMQDCAYLVLPSIWYENSPRVLIEALGSGLPVIASRLGALAELIDHEVTGLLFEPNSATSLAETLRWAEDHPHEMRAMGQQARRVYEERYSPDRNYATLVDIYDEAIASQHTEKVA